MDNIFSKMVKNFKKEEPQKIEPVIKFPTDPNNKVIQYQRMIQNEHSLEIQKQDKLKKEESKRKELAKEKAKQEGFKKQQNEIYLAEFEKVYIKQDIPETINDRLTKLKANPAELFLLYLFHFKGTEKLKDDWYMKSLREFINERYQVVYSPEEIEHISKERFLLLINVRLAKGDSTFVNLSFFNNICLTTDFLYDYTELELWSPYYFLDSSIHEREPDEYEVFYSNYLYLYLNRKDKDSFVDYFTKINEITLKDIHSTINKLQGVREQLTTDIKNMIYNFVEEIPEQFMLNPYLYLHLEYYIAFYNFGESIVESSFNSREMKVGWHGLGNHNTREAAKSLKNDYFDRLNSILRNKVEIEEEFLPALVWLEFRDQAKNYYSFKWIEEYGVYFQNDELNMDNLLLTYFNINEIDILDTKNIGYLTYYLMNLRFFDDNTQFMANHTKLLKELEELKKQMDLTAFEQKLMKKTMMKNQKNGFVDLDLMTGNEFEHAIAELFKKMGYFAVVTKASGDQGIDIIAEKEGRKFGIQTKCYSSKVTNTAVQETAAGIVYYKCDRGIVITNNYFTPSAIELAEKNNIILWNRDMLKEKFKEFMEQ